MSHAQDPQNKPQQRFNVKPKEQGIDNRGFVPGNEYLPNTQVQPNYESRLDVVSTEDKDDESGSFERESWASPYEFLMSCISMSVGLGNIWRFPYTAYKNGGGAFIIPYIIVLIVIGRPIYYLEMALGQFASYGSVKIWKSVPFFKGIGYIGALAAIITLSYYCSIIATTIYYLVVSFQKTLPWTVCDASWGGCNSTNAPDFYYKMTVTQALPDIEDGIGQPLWWLTLCLLGTWLFIFFSLIKGVQSSGKVAYVTAIFPYVVLVIFLVRGVTLKGSLEGIKFFIYPQWNRIYDPNVWYAAVGQCFFSLGTGTGPIAMFSSYNPFRHPAYRDALIISLMDTFTSLLAGFTIFAVLGHLAFVTNVPVDKVTTAGPGLVFISYPNAISQFSWAPQLFSVLFFLMLFTLGIGSANALAGVPITIVSDQFPKIKKWIVTLVVCILGFLSGLMYVTPGGGFMVDFMDFYGANFLLYFLGMMEVITIAWFYGLGKFIRDLEFMTGVKVGWYWKLCWGFVIPVGLLAVLIYTFADLKPLLHGDVGYPRTATIIGWSMAGLSVILLPLFGLHAISKSDGKTTGQKFCNSFKPKPYWGPRSNKYRSGWEIFKTLTNMKYVIPVTDSHEVVVKVRGHKERVVVAHDKKMISIRFINLSPQSTMDHQPEATGIMGWIHRNILRVRVHTWNVIEDGCENFRITASAGRRIIQNVHEQKMYNNDLVITIKF